MKNKKVLWIILLILGCLAFLIPLAMGIFDSINGFAGLCFVGCKSYHGFPAFRDSIILYSYLMWPTYIVGIVLIILSTIKLRKQKSR